MGSINITNDIKKLFIVAFREIFAEDTDFPYNKTDASLGQILITAKFAKPDPENMLPQLIVSTVGYSASQLSFADNLYSEVPSVDGIASSTREYSNIVQFQLSIDCVSSVKAECELVADKIFNSLMIEDATLFTGLNINIRNAQTGEATPRNQYPQDQYVTPVTVQGDFVLIWTMKPLFTHPLLAGVKTELKYTLDV